MAARINWAYEETSLLLALWSESTVQKQLGGTCTKKVFGNIAEQMEEHGYGRTAEQCMIRIEKLRIAYTACKAHNRDTDRCRRHLGEL